MVETDRYLIFVPDDMEWMLENLLVGERDLFLDIPVNELDEREILDARFYVADSLGIDVDHVEIRNKETVDE